MISREMRWELADVIGFPLDDIADEVLDLSVGSLVMAPYAVIHHYTCDDLEEGVGRVSEDCRKSITNLS